MNQVNIIGNLTKDVELRYTTDQKPIAKFSVAVNDGYGEQKKTSFIPIVVFGKQAENADKFLSKGCKVAISGRIQTGSYEKDGRTIYTTDVIANSIDYLNSKPQSEPSGYTAIVDDDVPF